MDECFKWVEMLLKESHVLLILSVCFCVFLMLKNTLIGLISRVSSYKFGEHEVNFGVIASKIENEMLTTIDEIPSSEQKLPFQIVRKFDNLVKVSVKDPNSAVLSAWRELELTAITLAHNNKLSMTGETLGRASGIAAIKAVAMTGAVSKEIVEIYEKIGRSIKPISAGELNCLPADAITFCQNAKRLSEYLTSRILPA